jgi:methyl-accepting chemotaxis protein
MKFSISKKIILIATSGVIASSVTILCVSTILMGNLLTHTIHEDMLAMQSIVERMHTQDKEQLLHGAQVFSTMPQFIEAVYEKNIPQVISEAQKFLEDFGIHAVAVTDEHGIVIARGHSDRVGDDFSQRSNTQAALRREIKAGILYDDNAVIPFTVRCDAPIIKDDVVIGTISLAYNIGSEEYIDNLQRITGFHFTIFKDDVIYKTSIRGICHGLGVKR